MLQREQSFLHFVLHRGHPNPARALEKDVEKIHGSAPQGLLRVPKSRPCTQPPEAGRARSRRTKVGFSTKSVARETTETLGVAARATNIGAVSAIEEYVGRKPTHATLAGSASASVSTGAHIERPSPAQKSGSAAPVATS